MRIVFKVVIGISILGIFLFNFDRSSLLIIKDHLTIPTILLSSLFIILSTLPTLIRWIFIAKKNYISSTLINLANYYYAGFFFNSISPANLGGDAYKFLSVKKGTDNSNQDIINVLLHERIYGFISLLFIVSFGFLLSRNHSLFISSLFNEIAIYLICFILFFILFFKKIILSQLTQIRIFTKLLSYINFRNANVKYDITIIILSFLGFSLWAASIFLVLEELNINLGFSDVLIISGLVEIIRFIPITFQGIGIREPSFALLASEFFGINFELAFLSGLIIYACLSLINIFLGTAFYFTNNFKN
jgi:glycosyltransferase 2 family protein